MKHILLTLIILNLFLLFSCNNTKDNKNNNTVPDETTFEIVGTEKGNQSSMGLMSFTYTPELYTNGDYCYKMELIKTEIDYINHSYKFTVSITGKEAWINEDGYSKLGKPTYIRISGTIDKETNKQKDVYLSPEEYYGKGTVDNPLIISFDYYIPDSIFESKEILKPMIAIGLYYYEENKDQNKKYILLDPYFSAYGILTIYPNELSNKEIDIDIYKQSDSMSIEEFINSNNERYSKADFWINNK